MLRAVWTSLIPAALATASPASADWKPIPSARPDAVVAAGVHAATGGELSSAQTSTLIQSLESTDPGARRVAAYGLRHATRAGQRSGTKIRRIALSALDRASRSDGNLGVRTIAQQSFDASRHPQGIAMDESARGFVAVAGMGDATRSLSLGMRTELSTDLRLILRSRVPSVQVAMADKVGLPTSSDLARHGMSGYRIGSRVADLRIMRHGSRATVKCAVQIRVTTWNGRDRGESLRAGSASARGVAQVTGSASRRGLADSKSACLRSALQSVASEKVAPFLRGRISRR